ncbi:hypothetical protein SAMN04489727_5995 [Amycolatopsis tolypomycina]|uniref:DUF5709 domain-containing protein n=1 Tax=Amycolatopsis tolypomycina TaxID=208445 RepID=A0A1H4X6P3_9PSEU|nr:hypothetical protein [Amycolatopsis tolypomycina]SED01259.1 hypothetical protein SAMN04489727_5995 [Amycolatopsis tolypomycina]
MTEPSYDPPQDTGEPDAVETDPVALNSAEDLDEDRIRADPLEEGMDPPEHWSGVTKYGMTPWEQAHPRGLGDRIGEELPDPATEVPPAGASVRADQQADADPDTGATPDNPLQLQPVEGDGPPADREPDQVGTEAGSAVAAGPEQGALHVEGERGGGVDR